MPRTSLLLWLGVLCFSLGGAASAEPLRFAALGDIPYSDSARRQMPRWLDQIAAAKPELILHVGDFKRARDICSDTLFADRRVMFDAVTRPLIFTPGDNEWSDCDQLTAGGFDPGERLDKLREVFFARPETLGQVRLPVEQQEGAPENLRLVQRGIVFLTLNLPAGNNYGPKTTPSAEFQTRNPQILAWLRAAFAKAKQTGARAVVVAFQANPQFGMQAAGNQHRAFSEFLQTLQEQSASFSGPVVAIHGDTHQFRFDRPMRDRESGKRLENFWRIEVPGWPMTGWVEIELETESFPEPASPSAKPPVRVTLHWLE